MSDSNTVQQKEKCQICQGKPSKYKCPGCMVKTCSLACSKKHKTDSGCSGERDKTKFIKRKEYDANTLMSDYAFLQDVARDSSNLRRYAKIKSVNRTANNRSAIPVVTLNRAQKNLANRARSQRQVHIKYISSGLQRHKQNKTIWSSSNSRLVWTIEFVVPELEKETEENKWVETGFHDVCLPGDLWTRLMNYDGSNSNSSSSSATVVDKPESESTNNPRKRARLSAIRIQMPSDDDKEHPFNSSISASLLKELKSRMGHILVQDLVWLIRVQDTPANCPTFCKINPMQPLFTQIYQQTVVEFPSIYIYREVPTTIAGHDVVVEKPREANVDNASQ